MFRIYKCRRCKNTGFAHVESEDAEARCSLCNGLILHESGTVYAATIDEAKEILMDLVVASSFGPSKSSSGRGIGLKKRVLNIIEALIEINRGHPATMDDVMRECNEAGIDLERASHFVGQLKKEGKLAEVGGRLMIADGGVV